MFSEPEDLMFNSGPVWHGTAIGWKKSINAHIKKIPVICERFCGFLYHDPDQNINILCYSAYLPTSGLDDEFSEILSLLSHDITNNLSETSTLIIGMDSNQSSKSTNRRINLMNDFIERFRLKSSHTNNQPTFHHNNLISNSQIDHIYFSIPNSTKSNICLNKILCKEENHSNLSSHDMLVGQISITKQIVSSDGTDFSKTYTEFINQKPLWDETFFAKYENAYRK